MAAAAAAVADESEEEAKEVSRASCAACLGAPPLGELLLSPDEPWTDRLAFRGARGPLTSSVGPDPRSER